MSLNNRQEFDHLSYKLLKSETSELSISQRTKGQVTSKNLQTYNSMRFKDNQELTDSFFNLGDYNYAKNFNDYRKKSLAYIRTDQSSKNVGILKKKKFN
jgi:hypothetical protein